MKNLLLVLPVLFLFGLTSCSDVMDNSFSTNPVLGKVGRDNIVSSSSFPYPYLFNFNKVDGVQYSPLIIDDNSVEVYLPPINQKYLQFYVIINYNNDKPASLFFIDRISADSFIITGLNVSEVRELSVYGFESINNTISPFPDNTLMSEIPNVWKTN
ncbi:MAG: hypothetical protein RBR74_03465, partial [Ignavibacteriaceae bacterium]|nr:hypothetical protein [Ignavibacteriaceae bacterium]